MSSKQWVPLALGALLVIGGLFLLLNNLFDISLGGLFWALILGLIGIFFILVFIQDRKQWWAIIPGITLLGVASVVGMDQLFPSRSGDLGGSIITGCIGLSFLLIFLNNRQYWWALIPGGVMLSISVMLLMDTFLPGDVGVGVMFIGFGLTFLALARVPTAEGTMKWPLIPGGVLLALGAIFFIFESATLLGPIVGSSALIVVGIVLLWRAAKRNAK